MIFLPVVDTGMRLKSSFNISQYTVELNYRNSMTQSRDHKTPTLKDDDVNKNAVVFVWSCDHITWMEKRSHDCEGLLIAWPLQRNGFRFDIKNKEVN